MLRELHVGLPNPLSVPWLPGPLCCQGWDGLEQACSSLLGHPSAEERRGVQLGWENETGSWGIALKGWPQDAGPLSCSVTFSAPCRDQLGAHCTHSGKRSGQRPQGQGHCSQRLVQVRGGRRGTRGGREGALSESSSVPNPFPTKWEWTWNWGQHAAVTTLGDSSCVQGGACSGHQGPGPWDAGQPRGRLSLSTSLWKHCEC